MRNNTGLIRFVNMKRLALAVKSGLKAGKIATNHNRTALRVRAGLKGGRLAANHSRGVLA